MIRSPFNRPGLLYAALGMGSRAAGAATHGGEDSAEDARRATITMHPAGPADLVCGHCGKTLPGTNPLPCACGSTVAVVPAIAGTWAGRKETT